MINPVAYWAQRGKNYKRRFQRTDEFERQEETLLEALSEIEFESVLEIGCGFGRITQLVRPLASDYVAIDVSHDQIREARRLVPDVTYITSSIQNFVPHRSWDLVLAVEVLMHIPPDEVREVIRKMERMSQSWVVTVDWALPIDRRPSSHNWLHDYDALLDPVKTYQIPNSKQQVFVS